MKQISSSLLIFPAWIKQFILVMLFILLRLTPRSIGAPVSDDDILKQNILQFDDIKLMDDQLDIFDEVLTIDITLWPGGIVIYEFEPDIPKVVEDEILKAMKEMETSVTCIEFVKRKDETAFVYVRITDSGCYSYIGKTGRNQTLNLQYDKKNPDKPSCVQNGIIKHEWMHALGIFHEQMRWDRNRYVKICWPIMFPVIGLLNYRRLKENYISEQKNKEICTLVGYGTHYCYGSVMHYPEWGFSLAGSKIPAMYPRQEGAQIGNRLIFHEKDKRQLNKMYCEADSCYDDNIFPPSENYCPDTIVQTSTIKDGPLGDLFSTYCELKWKELLKILG